MTLERVHLTQAALLASFGDTWPAGQVEAAAELLERSDGKFPPAARRLPAELVRAVQRERLIMAMLRTAAELGYRAANVQDVIERAGVSRPTFYEHFANKEECFLEAFDSGAERLRRRVGAAARRGGDAWRERVRLGLEELLRFAAREPETARAIVVEARAASAAAVRRRAELVDGFAACLEQQAAELTGAKPGGALMAHGIVGGIESVLFSRLCKGEQDELESLLPSLLYFVVLPYEGHRAAGGASRTGIAA